MLDAERLEHDALGAFRRLVAMKQEAYRAAGLDEDRVRVVPIPHQDTNLLHVGGSRRALRPGPRPEEVPQLTDNESGAEDGDDDVPDHAFSYS